jgi:6-phosphogluconolactonase (cycloisomerase 2 family)
MREFRFAPCLVALIAVAGAQVSRAQELTFVSSILGGEEGLPFVPLLSGVAVSPDSGQLYVTSQFSDRLLVFACDPATGEPSFLEEQVDGEGGVDGLAGAFDVAVSGDGHHVYATGSTDDAVAVFARDAVSGALSFIEVKRNGVAGVSGLDEPAQLLVGPEDQSVYVVTGDDAVVAFSREPATGMLGFVGAEVDTALRALRTPYGPVATADGAFLYVPSVSDDGISLFSRVSDGALSFVADIQNGDPGVTNAAALDGPVSVALSADERFLYVATYLTQTLSWFERDAATGLLAFAGAVAHDETLDRLAFAPDGRHLFATTLYEDEIAIFPVDPASGAAGAAAEVVAEGVGGVVGINNLTDLAIAPDGRFAYASSGDGLATFELAPEPGATAIMGLALAELLLLRLAHTRSVP